MRDTLYLSCRVVYFVLEMATLYEITHFAKLFPILPLKNIRIFTCFGHLWHSWHLLACIKHSANIC